MVFPNKPLSLKNNDFISKDICNFINENINLFREERLHIGNTVIVIYTVLNGQREPPGLASIAAKIYTKVYGWAKPTSVPLVCYLFLLDYPKRLDVLFKSDITSDECNSGSTTFDLKEKGRKFTEVMLWRQEEWEKVFYHELIHAFHLDTLALTSQHKMDAKLRKRLPFYNNTIQEAYAEVLATVLACQDKKVMNFKDEIIFMGSQVNKIIYFYHSAQNGHVDKLEELARNKTPNPFPVATIENESMIWAFFSQYSSSSEEEEKEDLTNCNFASYYILKSIYFWASLADPQLIQVSNLLDPDFVNKNFYATLLKSLKSGDYVEWLARIYFVPTTDSLKMTLSLWYFKKNWIKTNTNNK